ncbi:PadR family transcriptional regulator [Oceanicoccus sagamiensis]|uniref:PadR family transcriptional regulator n=1 Tax=Oceanicoccus sagamiensis TaxID=716816 RepID=A0A1X9N5N2_9GAMM|nr:PadR family transcriptional regulator [Oceanicoccus sagamiensis]ARN73398.1 hypothetical protein BST96_04295 [Oceanicoccus sagamiensis]
MSLKHALLAMLDIDKGSGYDLIKRFDQSVAFFWPSSFQQVYKELTWLEDKGFILAEAVNQQGKPDKKIYQVTDSGGEELQRWLSLPAKEMKIKDTFLIKVFGGQRSTPEQLLEDLHRQQRQHKENLASYKTIAHNLKQLSPAKFKQYALPYQTLKLGIRFEETWLEWSEETELLLSRGDIG